MRFLCTPKTWRRVAGLVALGVIVGNIRRVDVPIPAEAEVRLMGPTDDLEVELFASEPMISNPAAIDIDSRGRVWVADIHLYRGKAANPPNDRILVLEDTTGSGRADKCTVFAVGLLCPMSICVTGDKVLVATSPDLWLFEDKDGDLKADGPPKKLLTGFGGRNHDHGAHSLTLGPDHKWWMALGDQGYDVVGSDGSHVTSKWGGIIRGEMDGSRLENVALNFRNPYEVCVSSLGEAFCSDNDDDGNQSTRLCWLMEGGNYGWYGRPPFQRRELAKQLSANTPFREHWHFRGHIPGNIPATICTGFGGPAGICYYEGDAFGPARANLPWHCDAAAAEVRVYPHIKAGVGFQGQQHTVLRCGDELFRPVDCCAAPDGSIYVADWYDRVVGGHDYKNPEEGRIFRVKPKGKQLARREKPGPYENVEDALEGLKSPNLATQFLARERLQRDPHAAIPSLKKLLTHADPNFRARALWVLDRMGGDARDFVLDQLKSPDPSFRAFAVRVLRRHGAVYAGPILAMADDPSAEVIREVLLALQNLKGPEADAAAIAIASRFTGARVEDRYLLEAIGLACTARQQMVYDALAKDASRSPTRLALLQLLNPKASLEAAMNDLEGDHFSPSAVERLLSIAESGAPPDLVKPLLKIAAMRSAPAEQRRLALRKMAAIIKANSDRRDSWALLLDETSAHQSLCELFVDVELQRELIAIVAEHRVKSLLGGVQRIALSTKEPTETRREAIETFGALSRDDAWEMLRRCRADSDPAIRETAEAFLVGLLDSDAINRLFTSEQSSDEFRNRALTRLLDSLEGAELACETIKKGDARDDVRKQLQTLGLAHPDAQIRLVFQRHFAADNQAHMLGDTIRPEEILSLAGDSKRGEQIFHRSAAAQCKKCHAINGRGENVGPDLGVIGSKFDRATLLSSILDPSSAIAPEYVTYSLQTSRGQVFLGLLVEKNDVEVALKTAQNEVVRVPIGEVEQLIPRQKSLMPDLVLRNITAQDAADLLEFLANQKKPEAVAGRPKNQK